MGDPGPAPSSAAAAERPRWYGFLLLLLAPLSLGVGPVMARLAYEDGTDPITLMLIRAAIAATVMGAAVAATGRRALPPRPLLLASLGLGAMFSIGSFGYMASVSFIPVSLAVLLFFTFPPMVAVISRFVLGTPLHPLVIVALGLAFAGLALALGVSLEVLDGRGIALAATGAVIVALMLVSSGAIVRQIGSLMMNLHMSLTACAIYALGALVMGGLTFPESPVGWIGILGAAASYVCGVLCMFAGIALLGPLRGAMMMNLEPVVTLTMAFLLLGEMLSPLQFAGVCMVLGGVLLTNLPRAGGDRG